MLTGHAKFCCMPISMQNHSGVIFFFLFVSTSLTYITIPKTQRKTKITWGKKLTTTCTCVYCYSPRWRHDWLFCLITICKNFSSYQTKWNKMKLNFLGIPVENSLEKQNIICVRTVLFWEDLFSLQFCVPFAFLRQTVHLWCAYLCHGKPCISESSTTGYVSLVILGTAFF